MKERPKCAVEGCKNKALVMFGGKFVCGDCVAEWNKKNNERLFNELKNGS